MKIFKGLFNYLKLFLELTVLILGYLLFAVIKFFLKLTPKVISTRFTAFAHKLYQNFVQKLDRPKNHSISRLNLIEISLQNLLFKKSRTLITVGGMAVGIGSIVFLVSIGYGLQEIVISRVARLEELKQADVTTHPNSELKINDEALSNFNNLNEVELVLPMISVVGRVTFKEAVSDMAVYGVTSQYLETSAIQPVRGRIFESEDLAKVIFESQATRGTGEHGADRVRSVDDHELSATTATFNSGEVAGVSVSQAEYGAKLFSVQVEIEPGAWVRVRSEPSTAGGILGYTKRPDGKLTGNQVWGGFYPDNPAGSAGESTSGKTLGTWVEGKVYLWQRVEEEVVINAVEGEDGEDGGVENTRREVRYEPLLGDHGEQLQQTGYMAQLSMQVTTDFKFRSAGSVLGITSEASSEGDSNTDVEDEQSTADDSNAAQTTQAGIDWIEIEDESALMSEEQVLRISLGEIAKRQAVVNRAVLAVLGIEEQQAIGQKFDASFIVMGKSLEQVSEKIESIPSEYEIVAVIPGDRVPQVFVPFLDLRSLGVANYSQVKLVAMNQDDLLRARQKIEAMGFVTRSVVDTVGQIESIFATTRLILGLLGMAALLVAALGMFNTLTVSLLERTREVGLMKALGMSSIEVKELFLIESLTMGIIGGMLGLVLGFAVGKILSLILSIFSVSRGLGVMDVSIIPVGFVLLIVILAVMVGIVTGLYPAKRSKTISALNALRYE
jgi:ABC-type antimicrobial peptide transport system permease subunit